MSIARNAKSAGLARSMGGHSSFDVFIRQPSSIAEFHVHITQSGWAAQKSRRSHGQIWFLASNWRGTDPGGSRSSLSDDQGRLSAYGAPVTVEGRDADPAGGGEG
jgi:hypothetical protein